MSVCLGSMHSICISQCIRWSPCTNWTGWGRKGGGGGSLPGPCLYASMWHMPYSPSLSLSIYLRLCFSSLALLSIYVFVMSLCLLHILLSFPVFSCGQSGCLWSPLSGENLAQPTSQILKIQNVGQLFPRPLNLRLKWRKSHFFSLNKYIRSKL